jgi:hypothetical protein
MNQILDNFPKLRALYLYGIGTVEFEVPTATIDEKVKHIALEELRWRSNVELTDMKSLFWYIGRYSKSFKRVEYATLFDMEYDYMLSALRYLPTLEAIHATRDYVFHARVADEFENPIEKLLEKINEYFPPNEFPLQHASFPALKSLHFGGYGILLLCLLSSCLNLEQLHLYRLDNCFEQVIVNQIANIICQLTKIHTLTILRLPEALQSAIFQRLATRRDAACCLKWISTRERYDSELLQPFANSLEGIFYQEMALLRQNFPVSTTRQVMQNVKSFAFVTNISDKSQETFDYLIHYVEKQFPKLEEFSFSHSDIEVLLQKVLQSPLHNKIRMLDARSVYMNQIVNTIDWDLIPLWDKLKNIRLSFVINQFDRLFQVAPNIEEITLEIKYNTKPLPLTIFSHAKHLRVFDCVLPNGMVMGLEHVQEILRSCPSYCLAMPL